MNEDALKSCAICYYLGVVTTIVCSVVSSFTVLRVHYSQVSISTSPFRPSNGSFLSLPHLLLLFEECFPYVVILGAIHSIRNPMAYEVSDYQRLRWTPKQLKPSLWYVVSLIALDFLELPWCCWSFSISSTAPSVCS